MDSIDCRLTKKYLANFVSFPAVMTYQYSLAKECSFTFMKQSSLSIHMKPIAVAPLVSPAEVPPTPSIESRAPCRT